MPNNVKYSFFFLAIVFAACSNSKKLNNEKSLQIIDASYTPIVGGARGVKGRKILLKIVKEEGLSLDSLTYHTKKQKLNAVKEVLDTTWVEAYFYENKRSVVGNPKIQNVSLPNSCDLIYRLKGTRNSLHIPDLKAISDTSVKPK